jgi:hypothetical protein
MKKATMVQFASSASLTRESELIAQLYHAPICSQKLQSKLD